MAHKWKFVRVDKYVASIEATWKCIYCENSAITGSSEAPPGRNKLVFWAASPVSSANGNWVTCEEYVAFRVMES